MGDATSIITEPEAGPSEVLRPIRHLAGAVFVLKLIAAGTSAFQRCLLEESAGTQIVAGALAESSTELRELNPDTRVVFEAMLETARHELIEDGMRNVVTEQFANLLSKDLNTIIPALVSVIETGRTTPVVAAEVLKELGRVRNPASRAARRWVLEHALSLSSAFIRDGAGIGLAWLSDPASIPQLRRAIESEPDPQTRADLQLVVDELAETIDV
jgi:hypothetical protein